MRLDISDVFGCVRMHSDDAFGWVRMRSEIFGHFRNSFHFIRRLVRFRKFSDTFGCIRMPSDAFGRVW